MSNFETLLPAPKKDNKTLITGICTGILCGLISATAVYYSIKSHSTEQSSEENLCAEYGRQLGYDVVYATSTCFVYMEEGVTVPLDVALDIIKENYIIQETVKKTKIN